MVKPLGLMFVLVAAVALAQPISLQRQAKAGDQLRYKGTIDAKVEGANLVIRYTLAEQVAAVESDGSLALELTQTIDSLAFDGEEFELGDEIAFTQRRSAQGALLSMEEEGEPADGDTVRIERLLSPVTPPAALAAGGEWTHTYSQSVGLPASELKFKLVGREAIGTSGAYKFTFEGKETEGPEPMTVKGEAWVSERFGTLLRLNADVTNMPVDGMAVPAKMTLELVP